jgi:hypothetical protein
MSCRGDLVATGYTLISYSFNDGFVAGLGETSGGTLLQSNLSQ